MSRDCPGMFSSSLSLFLFSFVGVFWEMRYYILFFQSTPTWLFHIAQVYVSHWQQRRDDDPANEREDGVAIGDPRRAYYCMWLLRERSVAAPSSSPSSALVSSSAAAAPRAASAGSVVISSSSAAAAAAMQV